MPDARPRSRSSSPSSRRLTGSTIKPPSRRSPPCRSGSRPGITRLQRPRVCGNQLAPFSLRPTSPTLSRRLSTSRPRTNGHVPQWQRDAAAALLANNPDAETIAIADELDKQADKDDRDAEGYENEAAKLRERADRTNQRAEALIQRAVELETAP